MKLDFVLDQVIELLAYCVLVFVMLLAFDHLKGWSVLVGLGVFGLVKLVAYALFYKLKPIA